MTAPPENKLDTVRKLLAKAERAATPEEAAAYSTKAAAMMAAHGIDAAHLAATGQIVDEIDGTRIALADPYARGKSQLLTNVAVPLRCRTVLHRYDRRAIAMTVFGYASDRERVEILYTSLLLQATTQLIRVRPDHTQTRYFDPPPGVVAAYRRSWLAGFSQQVYVRLLAAEDRAVADADTADTGGPSTALVIADRSLAVTDALAQQFPNMRNARPSRLSGTGLRDGAAAGRRADLSTGTDHLNRGATRRIGAR